MKDRIQSLYPSGYLAKSKITPEHAVFAISLPCRQLRKSQIVNSCSNPLLVFFLLHSSMLLIFLLRTYAHDWLGQDITCPINCILPALRASTGELVSFFLLNKASSMPTDQKTNGGIRQSCYAFRRHQRGPVTFSSTLPRVPALSRLHRIRSVKPSFLIQSLLLDLDRLF